MNPILSCACGRATFQPSQPSFYEELFCTGRSRWCSRYSKCYPWRVALVNVEGARAALCRRDQSAKVWLRACLASQVSRVGDLQEQHSNQYAQHLLPFCELMTNRTAKLKTKKMTQMCWVMLPPHGLAAAQTVSK